MRELLLKMRDIIIKHDLICRLTITMWTETTIPGWLGTPDKPQDQIFARKSLYELYREGGFDAALYKNDPGLKSIIRW